MSHFSFRHCSLKLPSGWAIILHCSFLLHPISHRVLQFCSFAVCYIYLSSRLKSSLFLSPSIWQILLNPATSQSIFYTREAFYNVSVIFAILWHNQQIPAQNTPNSSETWPVGFVVVVLFLFLIPPFGWNSTVYTVSRIPEASLPPCLCRNWCLSGIPIFTFPPSFLLIVEMENLVIVPVTLESFVEMNTKTRPEKWQFQWTH